MSETRKLYYEDVYQKEFTAEVLECRETDRGYEVVLDQTDRKSTRLNSSHPSSSRMPSSA